MTAAETLLTHWQRRVAEAPQATALIEAASGTVFSRQELAARGQAWLRRHDPERSLAGQRVVFALSNSAAWFDVFLGLLECGAVPVPADSSEPVAAQRELASRIGAAALLIDGGLERLSRARPARGMQGVALAKLTSGSTGLPRLLPFTDAEMIADGLNICATMDVQPADINYALIPFGHSYGLGNLVMPLLLQGTASVCASSALPHAVAEDLGRWKPTIFPLVPALVRALNQSSVDPAALANLRTVISAGSALAPDLARAFADKFQRRIHGFYGSTETGGIAYDRDGEATLNGRSVGPPLEGVRLRLRRDGRAVVTSAAVFTRGNRRLDEGCGAFTPADQIKINEHGEVVVLGRVGRHVKIAGRRLNLAELETALRALPEVRDAYVTLQASDREELAAALASDEPVSSLRLRLAMHLAAWKCPRRLVVLREFPVTARGKIDTRALEALLARPASTTET